MTRITVRFSRKDQHNARLSRLPVNTVRDLLTTHGTAIFGDGEWRKRVIIRLLALPAKLLDTPLLELTAERLETLEFFATPTRIAAAYAAMQVLMRALARAHRLGLIAHAPSWLAAHVGHLESHRARTRQEAVVALLDAREVMIRVVNDIENEHRAAAGKPLRCDLRGIAYVDDVKPVVLLNGYHELAWHELLKLEWSDIDRARGVVQVHSAGGERSVALDDRAKDILRKWSQQSSASQLVFPPQAGQTQAQHERAILDVAEDLVWLADPAI